MTTGIKQLGPSAFVVYRGGEVVAQVASYDAATGAARLLEAPGIAGVTQNGRHDGHGQYVRSVGGRMVCAFCREPV